MSDEPAFSPWEKVALVIFALFTVALTVLFVMALNNVPPR